MEVSIPRARVAFLGRSPRLAALLAFVVPSVSVAPAAAQRPMHFVPAADVAMTGIEVEHVEPGDFDGDGTVDLWVGAESALGYLLHGRGDGSFDPPTVVTDVSSTSLPHVGAAVAVDVDRDGDLDLAIASANRYSGHLWFSVVSIWLNDGRALFRLAESVVVGGGEPRALRVGDEDGDGWPDLWLAFELTYGSTSGVAGLAILRNTAGTFAGIPGHYHEPDNPSDLAVADFDGDGRLDVAVAHSAANRVVVRRNLGGAPPVFASPISFDGLLFPTRVLAGDVTGDGHVDLIVIDRGTSSPLHELLPRDRVVVFPGRGDGSFAPVLVERELTGDPEDAELVDLDRDGDLDLVVATTGVATRGVAVLRNRAGVLEGAGVFPARMRPRCITSADVDGDGVVDLIVGSNGESEEGVRVLRQEHGRLFQVGPAIPGGVTELDLYSPLDAGRPFVFAFSDGSSPGTPWFDGRTIPLNPGPLLDLALVVTDVTLGAGIVPADGSHAPQIPLPDDAAWIGQDLHAAFVTLDPPTARLETISPPLVVRVDSRAGVRADHTPPRVDMVERSVVSVRTPGTVHVYGEGFAAHPSLQITAGGQPVVAWRRLGDRHLEVDLPPNLLAGWHDLTVASPSGSSTLPRAFYTAYRVRISTKFILDGNGRRTSFWPNYTIRNAVDDCNRLTLSIDRGVWYELEEIRTANQPQWWTLDVASSWDFETQARADPGGYRWRVNAVNFYVPGLSAPSWGYGMFPWEGDHIVLASDCWSCPPTPGLTIDHELGHYLGLLHTHDPGEQISDTPFDPWTDARSFGENRQALEALYGLGSPDYLVLRYNLMSYHSSRDRSPVVTTLTPTQIHLWQVGLLYLRNHTHY